MPDPIEITGLCSRYGPKDVLSGVTLNVREGEILGLAGLLGAGKSTLVRSILRLVEPSEGNVCFFGSRHDHPDSRAQVAYLPERFQPPGHFTGHDFIRLTLAFYRQRVRRAVACNLAETLDLDPASLRYPIRGYGKAMVQKLGVVATLLTDRPLLILDEPMSGLDPRSRGLLKRQLAFARNSGRTVLMSSHILTDHEELCDRVAVLHQGRLGYVGSPDGLKEHHGEQTLESAFLAAIDAPRRAAS